MRASRALARLATPAWLLLLGSLSGCSLFVAPNPGGAPLRASLAAEALYAGPLKNQPKELALLGTRCDPAAPDARAACRFGESAPRQAVALGEITLLVPSDTGASLRAPWIRWTGLHRVWDAAAATEYRVADLFWLEGEEESYTPLYTAFRSFEQVTRQELTLDQHRLRYDLADRARAVLVARVRTLVKAYGSAEGSGRRELEGQIRAHLELLALVEQRAEERVRRLEALAEEEARLYTVLADTTRTFAGLQRNVTNHLMKVDLVLSADEAKALAEAAGERLGRIREVIDAGRQAELEEQKKAWPPEWVDRLRDALERARPRTGE
jgi:hypothetical protein